MKQNVSGCFFSEHSVETDTRRLPDVVTIIPLTYYYYTLAI